MKYKFGDRVTVNFEEESYYYGDQYLGSWSHYGEETAEDINEILSSCEEKIQHKINIMILAIKGSEFLTPKQQRIAINVLKLLLEELMK